MSNQNRDPPKDRERARHSRDSSTASARQTTHAPLNPSQLREVHIPAEGAGSPEHARHAHSLHNAEQSSSSSSAAHPDLDFSADGIQPGPDHGSTQSNTAISPSDEPQGILDGQHERPARNRLLSHQNWDAGSCCGTDECVHGAMSPRPWSLRSYGTMNSVTAPSALGGLTSPGLEPAGESSDPASALLGDAIADGLLRKGKKSTTKYLAKKHGIKNRRMMWVVTEQWV